MRFQILCSDKCMNLHINPVLNNYFQYYKVIYKRYKHDIHKITRPSLGRKIMIRDMIQVS